MRYRNRSALVAAILVAAGLGMTLLWPGVTQFTTAPHAAAADTPSLSATALPNSVTVSASGEVHIAPDMATVTFGVLLKQDTAQDAQAAVNHVVAAAVQNLHALGITDRQIQTADLSLEPSYDNAGTVTGYQASQTLSVDVQGLRLVGRAVDAGVRAQANHNVSITFGLRDENAARTAALAQAVSIARTRAAAAATALGRSLNGAHVQLSEVSQPVPRPVVPGVMSAAPAQGAPTQTFGGTLTVHEDVTLTYTF